MVNTVRTAQIPKSLATDASGPWAKPALEVKAWGKNHHIAWDHGLLQFFRMNDPIQTNRKIMARPAGYLLTGRVNKHRIDSNMGLNFLGSDKTSNNRCYHQTTDRKLKTSRIFERFELHNQLNRA